MYDCEWGSTEAANDEALVRSNRKGICFIFKNYL